MRLLFFLLFSQILYGLDVRLDAKYALLMNAKSGRVLYEKNGFKKTFPASTTKIGIALYILEKQGIDYDRSITPSDDALLVISADEKQADFSRYPAHRLEHDGINLGIRRQENLPLWAAFYGMMIYSANDCANALAEAYGGSIPSFTDDVNQYLREIGCMKTRFMNPHGLHHPEHVTTAYELAVMMKKALEYPEFREIISASAFVYPKTNRQKEREISQGNRLIKPSSKYYYPHAIGGKTGYTKAAGNNLVAVAEKNGRELVAVLLGDESRVSRYVDAAKLFDAAFAENEKEKVIIPKYRKFSKNLPKATTKLDAYLREDVQISYYPSEEPKNLRAFVFWKECTLPIQKDAIIGEVRILDNEEVLVAFPLYARSKVEKKFLASVKDFFSNFF